MWGDCGRFAGGGENDGYFDVSINHTLDTCQAAKTTRFSGVIYILLAYGEIALERVPKESQQQMSTSLRHHAGHFQMQYSFRSSTYPRKEYVYFKKGKSVTERD